jgi:hypothetical protein
LDDGDLVVRERVEALGDAPLDAVLDGDDPALVLAVGDRPDDGGDRLAELDVVCDGPRRAMGVRAGGTQRDGFHRRDLRRSLG